jgi:hypothetical protein
MAVAVRERILVTRTLSVAFDARPTETMNATAIVSHTSGEGVSTAV